MQLARQQDFSRRIDQQNALIAERQQQQQQQFTERQRQASLQALTVSLQNDVTTGVKTPQQAQSILDTFSGGLPDFQSIAPELQQGPSIETILDIARMGTPNLGSALAIAGPDNAPLFAGALETRQEPLAEGMQDFPGETAGFTAQRGPGGELTGESFIDVQRTGKRPAPRLPQEVLDRIEAEDRAEELKRKSEDAFAGAMAGVDAGLIGEREREAARPVPQIALEFLRQGLTQSFKNEVSPQDIATMAAQMSQGIFTAPEGADGLDFNAKMLRAVDSANSLMDSIDPQGNLFRYDTAGLPGFEPPPGQPDAPGQPPPAGNEAQISAIGAKVGAAGSSSILQGEELAIWENLSAVQKLQATQGR